MKQSKKSPFMGWQGGFFARAFRRKISWVISVTAAMALGGVAYAAYVNVAVSVRIAPIAITVASSGSLPPEVQALEAQTASALFDRDTKSLHTAYAAQDVELRLERSSEIQAIKVY